MARLVFDDILRYYMHMTRGHGGKSLYAKPTYQVFFSMIGRPKERGEKLRRKATKGKQAGRLGYYDTYDTTGRNSYRIDHMKLSVRNTHAHKNKNRERTAGLFRILILAFDNQPRPRHMPNHRTSTYHYYCCACTTVVVQEQPQQNFDKHIREP